MSMSSGDAADEVVRMMLSGAELTLRLTASATKNLLAITIALAKSHKQLYGRTNMKKMLRETRDIRVFPMEQEQFRAFEKQAKKYGLLLQLDSVMLVQPIDEERAKECILQLASARYDAIGSAEYETQRLKRLFAGAEPMNILDAEMLKSAVSDIQISGSGTIRLCLKNNQILGDDSR